MRLGWRVQGLGIRILGLRFKNFGVRCRVGGLGVAGSGLTLEVEDLKLREAVLLLVLFWEWRRGSYGSPYTLPYHFLMT